jgi:phosphatidylserine decarboxylase
LTKLPIAKEGLVFVLPSLLLALLCYLFRIYPLAILVFLLTLFFIYFFRNPQRWVECGSEELISPADGRVMAVEDLFESEFLKEEVRRISIFMSVSDVHVNRSPCEGSVERVRHVDGKFKLAFKKGIGDENERNYVVVRHGGEGILVVQIAGFLARRIICYVRERDKVDRGQTIGMIAFGSRVDVYMPLHYEALVQPGQKVKSGLTVLAKKQAGA